MVSLRGVSFTLVVTFVVCLDTAHCAGLHKIGGDKVVALKSGNNTVEYAEGHRTLFIDETAVEEVKNDMERGEVEGRSFTEESRKGQKKQKEKGFMERVLPLMVMPFMVSTSMIPMMLISLKLMLLKSAFIGKIAIILMLINMLRRRTNGGGVFSNNIHSNDVAMQHYGYHGDEEYGAYVNKRRKRDFS